MRVIAQVAVVDAEGICGSGLKAPVADVGAVLAQIVAARGLCRKRGCHGPVPAFQEFAQMMRAREIRLGKTSRLPEVAIGRGSVHIGPRADRALPHAHTKR